MGGCEEKMSGVNANSLLSPMPRISSSSSSSSSRSNGCKRLSLFSCGVLASSAAVANPSRSSEERVYEVVLKQAALVRELPKRDGETALDWDKTIQNEGISDGNLLDEAYSRCGEVCAEYAKTFYLGKLYPLCSTASFLSCHFSLLGYELFGCHNNGSDSDNGGMISVPWLIQIVIKTGIVLLYLNSSYLSTLFLNLQMIV